MAEKSLQMTDYIKEIINLLENNGINVFNYDDDKTYFDGYDDVYVLHINDNLILKFVQNYIEKDCRNVTLFHSDKMFNGYDNVINELKSLTLIQ